MGVRTLAAQAAPEAVMRRIRKILCRPAGADFYRMRLGVLGDVRLLTGLARTDQAYLRIVGVGAQHADKILHQLFVRCRCLGMSGKLACRRQQGNGECIVLQVFEDIGTKVLGQPMYCVDQHALFGSFEPLAKFAL